MREKTLGEIAYEAYANARERKAFDGTPIPYWESVSKEIQEAWEHAAKAVRAQALLSLSHQIVLMV